jgi:glucokinase
MLYILFRLNAYIGGFNTMERAILAIDIGGSKYMVGLVGENGEIYAKKRYPSTETSGDKMVENITIAARRLLDENSGYQIEMTGVTIPGLADPKKGYWVEACFSGIHDLAIGPTLEYEFGVPAYVDNDGQACALAERIFGACRDIHNFIYLTVSNGIGGAVFARDKIYYGAFGNAGEFGHVVVVEDGRLCKCGKKGCLEMYAAGPGIVLNYIKLGGCQFIGGKEADAERIAALAKEGNSIAIDTFKMEGYYLGKVIAAACNLLNPAIVIIGGGVSLSFSIFEKDLLENIQRFTYISANKEIKIMPSALGDNGGLLGAAAVAICGRDKKYGWGEIY